jgi:hypothetical protein
MPVAVVESYKTYDAPTWVGPLVERMLAHTPEKYLTDLGTVVLSEKGTFNRKRRRMRVPRRGRKIGLVHAAGLYHREWKGERAWIELFVDSILGESRWPRFPIARDVVLGMVLFHELGHHVHATTRPEFREKEDVADDWSKKFLGNYFRKEYRHSWPVLRLTFLLTAFVFKRVRKLL